jgi:hypothetical protein
MVWRGTASQPARTGRVQLTCGNADRLPTRYDQAVDHLCSRVSGGGKNWRTSEDGQWPAACPIPASRERDSQHGDRRAWKCPPCGDGGGSGGASPQVAPEVTLGEARLRAQTGHKPAWTSGPPTVGAR